MFKAGLLYKHNMYADYFVYSCMLLTNHYILDFKIKTHIKVNP